MSRVIAAPLAGETLAARGADVLWVTPPSPPIFQPWIGISVGENAQSSTKYSILVTLFTQICEIPNALFGHSNN